MTGFPPAGAAAEVTAAAILVDERTDVDRLLGDIAREQQAAGRRVCGLLMTYPSPEKSCAGDMVLLDIETRERYLVSQRLGPGSQACRADTQGFARASQVLRRAVHSDPDLVICNRFGALEAEGEGFAAELLELMSNGVPLLTAVARRHFDAWKRFSGEAPVLTGRDEVGAWLARRLAGAGLQPDRPGTT
jgi:nucleoside-triphosphatase THEP1